MNRSTIRQALGRGLAVPLLAALVAAGSACSGGDDEPAVASADGDDGTGTTETTGAGDASGSDPTAYSDCLRDQGIEVGDPDPQTGVPDIPDDVDPSGAAFQDAMEACQDLLPEGGIRGEAAGEGPSQDVLQEFAECMRQNGLPDFPDPQPGSDSAFGELDRGSPAFQEAADACQDILG